MKHTTLKQLKEKAREEFETDGLLNIGKYDHERLDTLIDEVWEAAQGEVKKEIRQRIKVSEIILGELEVGNAMEGDSVESQIDHETSSKVVLESLLQALNQDEV